jgi:hypothetical protein
MDCNCNTLCFLILEDNNPGPSRMQKPAAPSGALSCSDGGAVLVTDFVVSGRLCRHCCVCVMRVLLNETSWFDALLLWV